MDYSSEVKGALQLLREMRARMVSPTLPENAEKVGALYNDLYSMPGAYQRGRQYQRDLGRQFGTAMSSGEEVDGIPGSYLIRKKDPSREHGPLSATLYAAPYSHAQLVPKAEYTPAIMALLRAKGLRPGNTFMEFDTATGHPGTGEGTQLYAHAYGDLLNQPHTDNIATSLSDINKTRRSLNMASAIGRDPRLADRILLHPDQLPVGSEYAASGLQAYGGLPPEGKLGALQQMAAGRMGSALGARLIGGDEMSRALGAGGSMRKNAEIQTQALARAVISALEPGASPAAAYDLAAAYQAAPAKPGVFPSALGNKSARKLLLTDQALRGQTPAWSSLDDWSRGLEYASGGGVPGARR